MAVIDAQTVVFHIRQSYHRDDPWTPIDTLELLAQQAIDAEPANEPAIVGSYDATGAYQTTEPTD